MARDRSTAALAVESPRPGRGLTRRVRRAVVVLAWLAPNLRRLSSAKPLERAKGIRVLEPSIRTARGLLLRSKAAGWETG